MSLYIISMWLFFTATQIREQYTWLYSKQQKYFVTNMEAVCFVIKKKLYRDVK